jgi:Kef-type K+ transport system membrane component KefB
MENNTLFLQLLIILLVARTFAEVAVWFHLPSIIGELFAGILLGPSLLGWIAIDETLKLLAEFGVILLLFEVGLGTDIKRLARSGKKSLIVAFGGFIFPFVFGFSISSFVFGLPLLVSMFIGGTLTATSIGITVRILVDLKRLESSENQVVLGAAVIDDVLGVVLLTLLYEFAVGGEISLLNTGKILLFVGVFFIVAPVIAKLISFVIKHFDDVSEIPGLIPVTVVSLVLFFAWLAHFFGLPKLLGGFAAGMALSWRFILPFTEFHQSDIVFTSHIEDQMKPIIQLFTPFFFVLVGMSLNFHEIEWTSIFIWAFSLSLFALAIIGKIIGALLIDEKWLSRWAIGIAMIPRGEVGLVFAEMGRESHVFSNEIYAGMVFIIALTTLSPPFILKWFYSRYHSDLPFDNNEMERRVIRDRRRVKR